MNVITHECPSCGTIVAANTLEENRVMNCPGVDCGTILRFDDVTKEEREKFFETARQYDLFEIDSLE